MCKKHFSIFSLFFVFTLSAFISSCGDAAKTAAIKRLTPPPPPPLPPPTLILDVEANSESGSSSFAQATSFDLGKITVGGNFHKAKSTSASFKLSGGMNAGH